MEMQNDKATQRRPRNRSGHNNPKKRKAVSENSRMGGPAMNGLALYHAGEKQKKPLHYTACGLDDVYLVSGYEVEDTAYGKGTSIKNADELHRVIGSYLVANKKLLSGKEIRFLRHQMDFTQSELARLLGG